MKTQFSTKLLASAVFSGIIAFLAPCATAEETFLSDDESSLDGLFGVKFGQVMPAYEACQTNNVGELAYDYTPETQFRGYTDYVIFATPLTRQVEQIRGVCYVDEDEIDDEVDATVKRLEAKFGKKALRLGDTRFIRFGNGDMILVTKEDALFTKKIYVDAVCDRLQDLAHEEVAKIEETGLAKDVRTLNYLPQKEDDDDKVFRLDSVFGVKFGEEFTDGCNPEKNNAGAWAYNYQPNGRFVDCADFVVFATAKTRKVFMVRAVYDGSNDGEATRHYDMMKRLVERVTGRKFKNDEAKGNDSACSMQFGDALITLNKNWLLDKVMLDFVRISVYRQNEREAGDDEGPGFDLSDDLDAL